MPPGTFNQIYCGFFFQAFAEKLHEMVRVDYWGYCPEEDLNADELHKIKYQVNTSRQIPFSKL